MINNQSNNRVISPNGLGASSSNAMSKSIIAAWLFGILFIASGAGVVLQFRQLKALKLENFNLQEEKKRSQTKREITNDGDLITRLQQIIVLPSDTPTIATVKDLDSTTTRSAFLANAINGDKMLIFRDRAILFRVSEDKIVNMVGAGNLSDVPGSTASSTPAIDASASGSATSESKSEVVKTLEIRNGTAIAGQAKVWQTKMLAKGYKVLAIGNAANDTYSETTLINLSGKDVSKLESELGLTAVTNLSLGEASSQADALIIIGTK